MVNILNLKKSKEIAVFFVATEKEVVDEELETTIFNYTKFTPSKSRKFDLFVFLNKIIDNHKIQKIQSRLESSPWINTVEFLSLDLQEDVDHFWYPWLDTPKPNKMPELGYTSGANLLFYRSIESMFAHENNYKNLIMLEADSYPVQDYWLDRCISFCRQTDFTIAGSKYKGNQECHYKSEYRDHLNGIAIYKNNDECLELIKESEKIVKKEVKENSSGYVNFDIAILLASKKIKSNLVDTDFIINLSDPRDKLINRENILKKFPQALIVHQKDAGCNFGISPKFFKVKYESNIPIYIPYPKCASEYTKALLFEYTEFVNEKDPRYDKSFQVKVDTRNKGVLIFNCLAKQKIHSYPKSLFKEYNSDSCRVDFFEFKKMVSEKVLRPVSIILDIKCCKSFDDLIFECLDQIKNLICKNLSFFTFLRDRSQIALSYFRDMEIIKEMNFESHEEREQAFFEWFKRNHHQKNFFVDFFGIKGERDFNILMSNINIFDCSIIDQAVGLLFKNYYGVENVEDRIYIEENKYNYTMDKPQIDLDKKDNIEKIEKVKNEYSFIYETRVTKKLILPDPVPVLLHVPKNAGSFFISTLTRYFVRKEKGDKQLNIQRLQINMKSGGHVTWFVKFINDSWKNDPRIMEYKFRAPRARETSFEVLSEYLKEKKIKLLSAVVEPEALNLEIDNQKTFAEVWRVLSQNKYRPVNFTIIRKPIKRAISLYTYLQSRVSEHESTHGAFKDMSIEEYLQSHYVEDSWTIRFISGIGSKKNITKEDLDQAIDFLVTNNFYCIDIKSTSDFVKHLLENCFGQKVIDDDIELAGKNSSESSKVVENQIPKDIINKYNQRARFDILLYQMLKDDNF